MLCRCKQPVPLVWHGPSCGWREVRFAQCWRQRTYGDDFEGVSAIGFESLPRSIMGERSVMREMAKEVRPRLFYWKERG